MKKILLFMLAVSQIVYSQNEENTSEDHSYPEANISEKEYCKEKKKYQNATYIGCLNDRGNPEGYGVMKFTVPKKKEKGVIYPVRYEGEFLDGDEHGIGMIYFHNGSIWTGLWEDGEQVESQGSWNYENVYNIKDIIFYRDSDYDIVYLEEKLQTPDAFYITLVFNGDTDISQSFTFDTGATDLVISENFLRKLKKSGAVMKNMDIDVQDATIANDDKVSFRYVRLDGVKVGNMIINNVVASVGPRGTHLLCGIGFFNKFSNVEWDMQDATLKLFR